MSRKIHYDQDIQQMWLLDAYDLHLATEEGTKRQAGKEKAGTHTNKADDNKSDLAIHIFGAKGELAVCRLLNLNPEEQWAGHDYTTIDDGIDLILPNEKTIDVKTRELGGDFALNPGRKRDAFKADYGVLVWLRNDRVAHIVGAFDAFMWDNHSGWIDFGRQQRYGFKGKMFDARELR